MIAIIHQLKWANCLGRIMCASCRLFCVRVCVQWMHACLVAKLYCQMFLKFRIVVKYIYRSAYMHCTHMLNMHLCQCYEIHTHTQQIYAHSFHLSPFSLSLSFISSCAVLLYCPIIHLRHTLHAPQLYSYSEYRLSAVKWSGIGKSSEYKLFAYIICWTLFTVEAKVLAALVENCRQLSRKSHNFNCVVIFAQNLYPIDKTPSVPELERRCMWIFFAMFNARPRLKRTECGSHYVRRCRCVFSNRTQISHASTATIGVVAAAYWANNSFYFWRGSNCKNFQLNIHVLFLHTTCSTRTIAAREEDETNERADGEMRDRLYFGVFRRCLLLYTINSNIFRFSIANWSKLSTQTDCASVTFRIGDVVNRRVASNQ